MKYYLLSLLLTASLVGKGQMPNLQKPRHLFLESNSFVDKKVFDSITMIGYTYTYDTVFGKYLGCEWGGGFTVLDEGGGHAAKWYYGYKVRKHEAYEGRREMTYVSYLDAYKRPIDPQKITVVLFTEKPKP